MIQHNAAACKHSLSRCQRKGERNADFRSRIIAGTTIGGSNTCRIPVSISISIVDLGLRRGLWFRASSDMASEDVKRSESAVSTIVNLAEEAKLAREVVKAPNLQILSICKSLVAGGVAGGLWVYLSNLLTFLFFIYFIE